MASGWLLLLWSLAWGGGGGQLQDHLPIRAGLEPLANHWFYTTFDVNVSSRADLQRTQCQPTQRLISMVQRSTLWYAFRLQGRGHRKKGVAHRKPSLLPVSGVHSMAQSILKIEGKFWYEGGLRNLSTSICVALNIPPPWQL